MNNFHARPPPVVALWLLAHAGASLHAESLAGDLLEEFNRGRSAYWIWRQVLIAACAAPGASTSAAARTAP